MPSADAATGLTAAVDAYHGGGIVFIANLAADGTNKANIQVRQPSASRAEEVLRK